MSATVARKQAVADARLPNGYALATGAQCGVSAVDPTGWRGSYFAEREVLCTRPPSHLDGLHVARGSDGRVLRIWDEG
jgi:hypothetical protein